MESPLLETLEVQESFGCGNDYSGSVDKVVISQRLDSVISKVFFHSKLSCDSVICACSGEGIAEVHPEELHGD